MPTYRHTLLPLSIVMAVVLVVGLHSRTVRTPAEAMAAPAEQDPTQLYQIGDQEFLTMNSGSTEDLASMVEKLLTKEKILLKKVAKRAEKHTRVDVNIKAGQIGIRGRPGPKGYFGPKGFGGPRGNRGARGETGPRGVVGPIGIKGIKGTDGVQGDHGPLGNQGQPGPPGPRGRRGREGRRGEEGKLGKNGPNGAPGAMGIMGPPGPAAYEGVRGLTGKQGPPGTKGYAGSPGISGDMGAEGRKGNNGAAGPMGDQGPDGESGKSVCGLATTVGKQLCCGEVEAKEFVDAGSNTLYVDIDTRKCHFTGQPMYFPTLSGNGYMKNVYTIANVVNPDRTPDAMSPDKFRVYLRNSMDDGQLSIGNVKNHEYVLKWCGVGSTSLPAPSYEMCCGASRSKAWTSSSGGNSAKLDVNVEGCGWGGAVASVKAPSFFTSIKDSADGKSAHIRWASVYDATSKGFTSRLTALPGQPTMTANLANSYNYNVEWCGVKPLPPTTNGKAGYPCTAPRVIVGNGDQAAQTNNAKICCEKTGSSGWKQDPRDSNFLMRTVDISPCGMKKIHVTLVDVRGDEGTVDRTGGGSAFSVGSDPNLMKVTIFTKGIYKFYDAERYHWHVQYCLVGI